MNVRRLLRKKHHKVSWFMFLVLYVRPSFAFRFSVFRNSQAYTGNCSSSSLRLPEGFFPSSLLLAASLSLHGAHKETSNFPPLRSRVFLGFAKRDDAWKAINIQRFYNSIVSSPCIIKLNLPSHFPWNRYAWACNSHARRLLWGTKNLAHWRRCYSEISSSDSQVFLVYLHHRFECGDFSCDMWMKSRKLIESKSSCRGVNHGWHDSDADKPTCQLPPACQLDLTWGFWWEFFSLIIWIVWYIWQTRESFTLLVKFFN